MCNDESSWVRSCSDHVLMTRLVRCTEWNTSNLLFEEVVRRYSDRVRRWCFKLTRNRDQSSDLSQEVFLKVFRKIHTFRGDSQLSTWIYVITRNHCLNAMKRNRRELRDVRMCWPDACIEAETVYCALEREQMYERLCCFLTLILSPLEMTVLTMHYVQDLSLPAITRILTLSNASGAKAYLVSARRKLNMARHHGDPKTGIYCYAPGSIMHDTKAA